MSEQSKPFVGSTGEYVPTIDEFYVHRINWLNTMGRTDLIDEIADDCERRRTADAGAHGPGAAQQQPSPVTTGTRLAVARLSRAARAAYRHTPDTESIRG